MAGYNDYRNPGSATAGNAADGGAAPSPQATGGRFYVDPSAYTGDHRAANINAALTRETLNEWLERYAPIGADLADDLRSGARLEEGLQGASLGVGQAFNKAEAANRLRRSRYGVQLSGQQKQAYDTSMALQRGAAEAGARNGMREIVGQADDELMAGM